MKANDQIPEDEMLLAEAIAAAKARGVKWHRRAAFADDLGRHVSMTEATHCCALGALALAGRLAEATATAASGRTVLSLKIRTDRVFNGNDFNGNWLGGSGWDDKSNSDDGESLGWAFRCAMTDNEEG